MLLSLATVVEAVMRRKGFVLNDRADRNRQRNATVVAPARRCSPREREHHPRLSASYSPDLGREDF